MKDTEFLEKLLRLAWKNGYKYLTIYGTNNSLEWLADTDVCILKIYYEKSSYLLFAVNIERVIFDHSFIKTLYKIREAKKNYNFSTLEYRYILEKLACSNNRIDYLRKEFEGLIK